MCVHRLLSRFGAGGCVLLAEKRLRQSFMTAAAFLFVIKPYPLRHISENGSLINCRFQKRFRMPVFESPPASEKKTIFSALTGRYHPARH